MATEKHTEPTKQRANLRAVTDETLEALSVSKLTDVAKWMETAAETVELCSELFDALNTADGALTEEQEYAIAEAGRRLISDFHNDFRAAHKNIARLAEELAKAQP